MSTLTTVSTLAGSSIAKYEYDNEGLRTKKMVGTKTYEYYYDGEEDNLTLEVISVNDQIQQYRYYQWDSFGKAIGTTIKQKVSDGTWKTSVYYFLTNQRGDVSSIVDNTGVEVGSYSYDSYGNIVSETGTIAKENNIRYASYYYDQETKHYYLKARYYDPVNGIFQALDPHSGDINEPLSQNGYSYTENNPINFIDPKGDQRINQASIGGGGFRPTFGRSASKSSKSSKSSKTNKSSSDFNTAVKNGSKTKKHSKSNKKPPKTSKPYSSIDMYQNGKLKQRRYYDKYGKPKLDIDYTDHGNPKYHKNPHRHYWINGVRQ